MNAVFIVAIIFGSVVTLVSLVCGTILIIFRMRQSGGFSNKDREQRKHETRMIQEIYQGLESMESRIESLETILLDHQHKDGKKDE